MKTIVTYCFDMFTKEYTGIYNAPEDPKHPGRYLIPAFATTIEPPTPRENQKVVWNGTSWQIKDIPQPEPEPEPTEEEIRQQGIWQLECLLNERYSAHSKLLATGAEQTEIDECKAEIQAIIAELEVRYNA